MVWLKVEFKILIVKYILDWNIGLKGCMFNLNVGYVYFNIL